MLCFDPDSWKVPKHVRKKSAKPPLYSATMRCMGRFDSVRVARLVDGDPDEIGRDWTRYYISQAQGVSTENDVMRLWM